MTSTENPHKPGTIGVYSSSKRGTYTVGYETGDLDEMGTEYESTRLESVVVFDARGIMPNAFYPTLEGIYVTDRVTDEEDRSYWVAMWAKREYSQAHDQLRLAEEKVAEATKRFERIDAALNAALAEDTNA